LKRRCQLMNRGEGSQFGTHKKLVGDGTQMLIKIPLILVVGEGDGRQIPDENLPSEGVERVVETRKNLSKTYQAREKWRPPVISMDYP